MANNIIIPTPQHRFLEPFKNRVFQYDTKHSNYFLSQYANGILNAIGNDVIIRGLKITPEIDTYATGLNFIIAKGALIHDQTFIEIPTENKISISEIAPYSNQLVIIYTNWRFLHTVYENPLKIEVTLYNKETRKTITAWSTTTNRVILGVFKFTSDGNKIIDVSEEKIEEDLVFEDSNIVVNGNFDIGATLHWIAINSSLKIIPTGGIANTPYVAATPLSNTFQGIGQVLNTKLNYGYRVSFYVKSDSPLPFTAIIRNADSIFDMDAVEVIRHEGFSTDTWEKYTLDFYAISNKTTLLLLKNNNDLSNVIYFDSIFALEFVELHKQTDIGSVKFIDGGNLD